MPVDHLEAEHSPVIVLRGDCPPKLTVHANPASRYGVEVSRYQFEDEAFFRSSSSDRHVVCLQLSGRIKATTWLGGRRLEHEPCERSLGISPAGVDSAVRTGGPVDGIVLRVSFECVAVATGQMARHGSTLVERMSGQDDVLFRLGRLLEAEAASSYLNGPLFWSSAADALIRRLATRHVSAAAKLERHSMDPRALKQVDGYIRANLPAALDLDSLAEVTGCDRFRFARAFRAATGMTPHRYVVRLRLARALSLLRSGKASLAETAFAAGFCDQSHMTNWFRRVLGASPSAMAGRRQRCTNLQDR